MNRKFLITVVKETSVEHYTGQGRTKEEVLGYFKNQWYSRDGTKILAIYINKWKNPDWDPRFKISRDFYK